MEGLIKGLLKNTLFVHYLTIILILLGVFSIFKFRREARPNVNFDRIAISVPFNGAAATEVEELILKPLEEEIDGLDGIKEYRSTAFEGVAAMSIEIEPDYPEKRQVIDEVQRAVNQAELPEDAEDPIVTEIKASKINVYTFSLVGEKVSSLDLRDQAKRLMDDLKFVEGVSTVEASGLKDLEYRVSIKSEVLQRNMVTLGEIMNSLNNWNRVSPAGEVDENGKTFSIRIDEQMKTKESIENHTVKAVDADYILKIKDLGTVKLQNAEVKQEYLVNGIQGISISVYKEQSADIVAVAKGVSKFLEDYKFKEGVNYITSYNDSESIQSSLKSIVLNAIFGMFLVLLTLMLFVSTRLAFITAFGIPVAFLGGLFALYMFGMTLNTLVVLGMVVVLGMLVDDAIVVAENIFSHVEEGLSPKEAAVKGVSEVASPVVATVLTTVFAFLPVVFMEGIMGQFLRVIPITVIIILCFSLFEALFILPVHCADILKPLDRTKKASWDIMGALKNKYASFISWSVGSVLSSLVVLGVLIGITVATVVVAKNVKFELFPRTGIQFLTITSEFPLNTHLDSSKEFAKELYDELKNSSVKEDIFSFATTLGSATKGGLTGVREQGSHLSSSTVRLSDDPNFIYREKKVIAEIEKIVEKVGDKFKNKVNVSIPRPGPPVDSDIELVMYSRDFEENVKASEDIVSFMKTKEGMSNIESDLMDQADYYRVKIDKELATENGLSFTDISRTIFSALYGISATNTRIGDDEVGLVVSLDKSQGLDIKDVNDLMFTNQFGALVPLKAFAKVYKDKTTPSIQRIDGKRAITIFGDVDAKKSTPSEMNKILKDYLPQIEGKYPSVRFDVQGADLQRLETLKETGTLYAFSLVGIFIVISLSFVSIGFPLLVLFAVPFGFIGVVWALFLHSMPLSLMGIIGVIGLSGVVVNSSIILIQFLLQELRSGVKLKTAVVEACSRRFRPIVITSITTFVGLAPTIYSVAGKDAFIQPLVLSLGWGLIVATLLTLFILPALVYLLLVAFID